MKKVQIKLTMSTAPNAQPQAALEMLIPTTWEFKGGAVPGSALRTGCYCDYFPIIWEAKDPNGSGVFQNIPDYSWQYSDDAQEMQRLNDPNRRARGDNRQVCPVSKPLTAEQFFRENLMAMLHDDNVHQADARIQRQKEQGHRRLLPDAGRQRGQDRSDQCQATA
jgi:hypothetical protein